ncbi:hypothetical protein G4228_017111 [Cervus hanglu yarkandensis]|nr:hypothetical protein G4228_017111 [Cervus hanglu yarkandensis]
MVGQRQEKKGLRDSDDGLKNDPRSFQPRPRRLLSADGKVFLNLWFIPHPSEVLVMFKTLPEKAAFRALKLTLQLIAPLHDIVAYLFSFAKLGNCPACFEFPLSPNPLRGDWGGTEGIGSELQELQKMIDSLQSPQDPTLVSQVLLLQREVMFLQFDAAVRYLIRQTFLAAGSASAYQSVTDGMYHGLPPLSNSPMKSIFASQLSLPQPLDPQSLQSFVLFPWRAFLEDGGPFPLTSSSPDTLEYHMQLCLCGLSGHDLKVAHGELAGMRLLMEDVLLSNYHMIMEGLPGQQATPDKNTQPDLSRVPGLQSSPKASKLLGGPCDAVTSLALLRSFLVLWKQLEVLKEHWGRLKLQVQDINSPCLHKQFSELYGTDILYPSMKAIARRMGKEDEFEEILITSQCILPPKGASEIEIKTQQLQKLLENLEIHMIQEVLKKVNKEITLVVSEKSKEQHTLPTDLWKHQVMEENFSIIRPQIVENFVQRLLENYQDGGLEVTFRKDHLEACLLSLGCDVMARERSNFESYSMCYEHILEHVRQKLCQKEQEKLDENQLNLIQKVCELIGEVRTEGIDNMKSLKKKWGSARPDEEMKENPAKEQLQALEQDNCALAALVRKLRSLGHWRLVVRQAHFRGQLSRAEKAQLLKELEHRMTQEALRRQQLDLMKATSMEKLLKDVEQKEQHLQLLTEDAKRASKLGQLQQKKIQRELRQVPIKHKKRTDDVFLPNVADTVQLSAFQV